MAGSQMRMCVTLSSLFHAKKEGYRSTKGKVIRAIINNSAAAAERASSSSSQQQQQQQRCWAGKDNNNNGNRTHNRKPNTQHQRGFDSPKP